jgi:hypothetical protein
MNDVFTKRVWAAAVAGWWLVLIVWALVLLQWFAYLGIMASKPAWLPRLWGPNINWDFIQSVWFWGIAVMKFLWWLLVLATLWLSLWAHQLRKQAGRA